MIDTIQIEMWQDLVFMVGGFVFAALLLPTLRDSSSQVPRTTSIPTTTVLVLYVFTFATLDMWLSAAAQLLSATAWFCIALWRAPTDDETEDEEE